MNVFDGFRAHSRYTFQQIDVYFNFYKLKEATNSLLGQIVEYLLGWSHIGLENALTTLVDHGKPHNLHFAIAIVAHFAIDGKERTLVADWHVLVFRVNVAIVRAARVERQRIVFS